jgi:hypothetical protein
MARKKTQPKDSANVVSAETIKQTAIQQGSPQATQTVSFTVGAKQDLEVIISRLIASLDQLGLDARQMAEVKANAEAVQALLKTEKPKASVVRECLVSIKDILQASATVAAASGAGQLVTTLLHEMNKALGMG